MIIFKNIDLKFNDKTVLKNFNLTIEEGEKVLIAGVSGKGKTTLLKILLGFTLPSSGSVFVDDLEINEKNIDKIRSKIGYMPQSTPFFNMNVEKLIHTILNYKQNSNITLDTNKLINTLKEFNLDVGILSKDISQLSGGEKQRLAFVITILLDRKIWVLDEITSSLDQDMKEKVTEYILNSNKTIILVSHDNTDALNKFRRVIL
ncbi:ABC transporter ATP-binding protein [Candidatus Cetobacterium colombiensis]|uniref:ABC transporter ATP-binding protein n=1 Tax=Candidatus Cetobacterium colombiensis TaxID=3073100 RepID=A0ABU4WBV8_9FUSO|nr:ABC transporter ATP-binding protein [Candidatus Cetobacterium colombiensis]MDX8336051.1 ABC transporter ATP-binding protein [Candidatus Cetobacterium colombiensis]